MANRRTKRTDDVDVDFTCVHVDIDSVFVVLGWARVYLSSCKIQSHESIAIAATTTTVEYRMGTRTYDDDDDC